MNTRHCPHPTCTVTDLPTSTYACRSHWFGLPAPIRVAVSSAWRLLGRGGSYEPLAEAQDAAVHYWETGEVLPISPVLAPRPSAPAPRRKGRR